MSKHRLLGGWYSGKHRLLGGWYTQGLIDTKTSTKKNCIHNNQMKIAFVSKIYFSIYQSYITPEMYFCGKIKMIEELFPVEQYFMILLKSICWFLCLECSFWTLNIWNILNLWNSHLNPIIDLYTSQWCARIDYTVSDACSFDHWIALDKKTNSFFLRRFVFPISLYNPRWLTSLLVF